MGTTTLLRLATAGSVDDGKSTLVGRLLHDSKNVLADQFAAVERASADRGLTGADLALLTDGLRAEREQGITIDVAYRYFATANRSFILADCPGHVQYTRNTVTGSSTADVVVLLVDVRHGVLEQTRRHLAVAALLRVPHVVVAVNKVDLVDWDENVYRDVELSVRELASALGVEHVHTVPVSALLGDNIVDRSTNMPWYDGPALLELLEELPSGEPAPTGTFRFPVQVVIRPQSGAVDPAHVEYRGYAGQVAAGTVVVGDAVTVLPSGRTSTVVGIDLAWDALESAHAGQSVTIRLADDIDIARGDILVSSHDAPEPVRETEAIVTWLSDRPLTPGARLDVKHLTKTVKGIVSEIRGRLDLDTLTPVPATTLELNDIGRVQIKFAAPLGVEDYAVSRRTGAFLLVDAHDGATVAAGMIQGRSGGSAG